MLEQIILKNIRMKAIFLKLCPNCGGDINDFRLSLKAPCEKCLPLPDEKISELSSLEILELLKGAGLLKRLQNLYDIRVHLEELDNLFYKVGL